jgi:hypothetical protein
MLACPGGGDARLRLQGREFSRMLSLVQAWLMCMPLCLLDREANIYLKVRRILYELILV